VGRGEERERKRERGGERAEDKQNE